MALPVAYKVGTSAIYGNVVARGNFTPSQQKLLDAGQNVNGYATVDGHFTYVGAGRTGEAARAAVYNTPAAAAPAAIPVGGGTYNPNLPRGGWMNPRTMLDGRAFPDVEEDKDAADKLARNKNALALIKSTLAAYGLPESLGVWAWERLVAGDSEAEILLELQQRPEFKNEYPEIEARLKAGLAPVGPGEIIAYRQQARQMFRAAGLPEGFYDSKDDFARYLTEDLSIKELGDRISIASQVAFSAPAEDRAEARRLGFTDGDWVAMALDPDVAEPLIQQRWKASQISGAGVRSGYGGLERDEALGLAGQGVNAREAQQGFEQLGQTKELFGALDSGEDQIRRDEQLSATFSGNADAQKRIAARAARRRAQFQGGGGYAGSAEGITGLGGSRN